MLATLALKKGMKSFLIIGVQPPKADGMRKTGVPGLQEAAPYMAISPYRSSSGEGNLLDTLAKLYCFGLDDGYDQAAWDSVDSLPGEDLEEIDDRARLGDKVGGSQHGEVKK